MTVRELFLPLSLRGYYLFSTRIVSLEITTQGLRALLLVARGRSRTVFDCAYHPIELASAETHEQAVARIIRLICDKWQPYHQLIVTLGTPFVTIKFLDLALQDSAKIRAVLPFEIESALSYPLAQAAVDSWILSIKDNKTVVGAVALKKEQVEQIIRIAGLAGVVIDRLTIDVVELIQRYLVTVPSGQICATMIYVGDDHTVLVSFAGATVQSARVLPYGIQHFGGHVLKEHSVQLRELTRDLVLFLQSKGTQDGAACAIELMGPGATQHGLAAWLQAQVGIPTQVRSLGQILEGCAVQARQDACFDQAFLVPLCAALAPLEEDTVDLMRTIDISRTTDRLGRYGILWLILFSVCSLAFVYYSWQLRRVLKQEIKAVEQEAITAVRNKIPFVQRTPEKIESVNNAARLYIEQQESVWSLLSASSRVSLLVYLQDFCTRLDRDGLGLRLSQLTLNEATGTAVMEGEVRDFKALQELEASLARSPYLKEISKPQDTKFVIKMVLDKSYGGVA